MACARMFVTFASNQLTGTCGSFESVLVLNVILNNSAMICCSKPFCFKVSIKSAENLESCENAFKIYTFMSEG
jgi:hypothetical protein